MVGICTGVLRLCAEYFGSRRTVYYDSAFASLNTAFKLFKLGLYFFGLVKTAHKEFPKKFIESQPIALRSGDSIYLTAVKDDVPLIACGWFDKCL